MRQLVLRVIALGCFGALCAPAACSSPTATSVEGAAGVTGSEGPEAVGEAAEAQQSCGHSTCTIGDHLSKSCNACTETVCNPVIGGAYCCMSTWDPNCVSLANSFCAVQGTQNCGTCTNAQLCDVNGPPLDSGCSPCTKRVCDSMQSCCTADGKWAQGCVDLAEMFCGTNCTPACTHDPCKTGGPLVPACSPCVETLCAGGFNGDKYCCEVEWDRQCVSEVAACEGCGRQ